MSFVDTKFWIAKMSFVDKNRGLPKCHSLTFGLPKCHSLTTRWVISRVRTSRCTTQTSSFGRLRWRYVCTRDITHRDVNECHFGNPNINEWHFGNPKFRVNEWHFGNPREKYACGWGTTHSGTVRCRMHFKFYFVLVESFNLFVIYCLSIQPHFITGQERPLIEQIRFDSWP